MIQFDEDKQNKKVDELLHDEQEELAHTLSRKYGINYIDLTTVAVNSDALRVISEAEARAAKLAVFDIVAKKIKVAVQAPENEETKKTLEIFKENGYIVTLYMVSLQSLEKVWGRYADLSFSTQTKGGAFDISSEEIEKFLQNVHSLEDVKKLIFETIGQKQTYKITKILEIIIAGALALKVSDIHMEPEEKTVRIRYRLDGVLMDILELASDTFGLLLSRIKLIAGMKLNVTGSQDGRFSIGVANTEIEIRASILPSAYNESIVLRVLNPDSISVPFEDLGISPRLLKILEREINRPEGMVLTTGPTGSGKTTTLYAFIKKVFSPEIKIITIENPIEYHVPGIVQTQTDADKGYTFLEGLRSALRQDPDVIMVGEIRDQETAEIAINAALTGHLVFSTLHTNNAAGTFPRLIDLGVNAKIIPSAVSVSMAQRLVRKLCLHCKKEIQLEGRTKDVIEKTFKSIKNPDEYIDHVPTSIFEPVGCVTCNMTGYMGRLGIYEAILRTAEIEKAIKDNPSERDIWKAAENQNILNMKQDGVIKILKGITSLPELERVVDVEND